MAAVLLMLALGAARGGEQLLALDGAARGGEPTATRELLALGAARGVERLLAFGSAARGGEPTATRELRAARVANCTADDYARSQFSLWDASGDALISASEVESRIAAVVGLPNLSTFPALRASVRAQYRSLDTDAPPGLDAAEFAAAAWARCGHACQCADGRDGPNATRAQLTGVSVAGSTGVPGLWHEIDSLKGDRAGTVQQMTLFNSNQLREMVKLSVEKFVAEKVADLTGASQDVLESVICGGAGLCSAIQLQIITGVGGLFSAFVDVTALFLAKLTTYAVPSFTLLQTFQTRGALGMEVPSLEGIPVGVGGGADALLDVVVLLHVVPGPDKTINKFLANTVRLPLFPAVALAHLAQDGGFSLDFSIASVFSSPGSISPGVPVLDIALQSELTLVATAYDTLLEYDDLNGNGVFDDGEPTGNSFELAELEWKPIQHTTSDGSCMTETDLVLLDLGTLQTICVSRGLPLCMTWLEHAELVAYLESNPVGCLLNVTSDVLLVIESQTDYIPEHPEFTFSISFVTSTRPLQNEYGTIAAPTRTKVNVEIKHFPFTLTTRPRLALKVAHAGAAPRVDLSVIGSIGLDVPFDFGGVDLGLLDAIGSFPGLPSFPSLPSIFGSSSTQALPGRLAMTQSNVLEVNRDGAPGATASYTAAVAAATAADQSLVPYAREAFGGDVVAAMLANGSLAQIPSSRFAANAYSSWDEHVFTDSSSTRATVIASALGTANVDIGSIGGLAARFFAGVNATASQQYVSFDTNSSYVLWDPQVGLGEKLEWRKARAELAMQASSNGLSAAAGLGGGSSEINTRTSMREQLLANAWLIGVIAVLLVTCVVALPVLVLKAKRAARRDGGAQRAIARPPRVVTFSSFHLAKKHAINPAARASSTPRA